MTPPPGPEFDWAAHTEAVAADIFGEPNAEMSRPPDDVRFCNHGSVSVNYTTGEWYDFESERGGGIKELIRIYKGIDDRDAATAYAEECLQNFENGAKPRPTGKDDEPYQQVVEATYPYCDTSGQVAFEVVRFVFKRPGGDYVTDSRGKRKKTFRQRRPSGESDQSWLWSIEAGEFMRGAPGEIGLGSTPLSSSSTLSPDSGNFSTPPHLSFLTGFPICSRQSPPRKPSASPRARRRSISFAASVFPRPAVLGVRTSGVTSTAHSCRTPTSCCCQTTTRWGENT